MKKCKCGENAIQCYDPYDEVILDKKTIITVCSKCYAQRTVDMEIWREENKDLLLNAYVGQQQRIRQIEIDRKFITKK